MTFCSTNEAAERSGATFRQLDYFVRKGFVSPPQQSTTGEDRHGRQGRQGRARRWRPVDVAAASAVADLIGSDPTNRPSDLAQLAARAVYVWHGRAPWVVVALEGDTIRPAADVAEACRIAETMTVATLVPLDTDG